MSYENKKIVACIVVRMKSSRLPKKALVDILGKPMTLRLIERLRTSKTIDEIILCTSTHPDDKILLDYANIWGVKALAGSEEDVLSRLISAAKEFKADVILRITGDNVLTDSNIIDKMVSSHILSGAEYSRTNNLPLGVTAEVMSESMLNKLHSLMPYPNQSEYMMLYAFDPVNFVCNVIDAPNELSRPNYSLTVDTPSDIKLIRDIYSELESGDSGPELKEVISFLDTYPEKITVSDDTPIRLPGGKETTFKELLIMLDERAEKARLEKIN